MQFGKNAVEAMAIEQGHHQLKFNNKKGIELGNSDWIAGVDCKDDSHQNQQNDEESDSNDDTDDKCTPELKQCKSDNDSSDNESHTTEDIEEEMDNSFDNNEDGPRWLRW